MRGKSGWPRTQRRELGGKKWLLTWVWDKWQKRMTWEVMKWGWVQVGERANGGWQYWGRFNTLGEWKSAVEKADF